MSIPRKTGSRAARGALCALGLATLTALVPGRAVAADVEFYAVADKEELSVDDTLTLTVTLSVDGQDGSEDVKLPEAPDFEVLSRSQSQQMSFNMTSGGPPSFRRVKVFTIILAPQRTGALTIGAGKLAVKGKAYETAPIKVKVLSAGSKPARPAPAPQAQAPRGTNPFDLFGGGDPFGGDPDALLEQLLGGAEADRPASDRDVFVRNSVDKKQVFLGEQINLSTYLFSRVDISGVDSFKLPKLDGFWAEDLETPTQITGELKNIDGEPYRVYLLRRRALFPLKAGKLVIDPVEVDVSTGFSLVFSGRKVHRASQPTTIEVQPLPPGAPAGFEAANVGRWRLSAEATPTTTQLGSPVTLRVTLEGAGNLHNVALPQLPALTGFKAYDPTASEKITTAKGRFGGRRTLEYLLMPTQTGALQIPALSLAYFDPEVREYRRAETEPIQVQVEAGGAAGVPGPSVAAGDAAPTDRAVNLLGADGLRPLRYKGELSRPSQPLYLRPFFLPLVLSPFVLWLGLGAFGLVRATLREGDQDARKRRAGSRTRKRLRTAEKLLAARNADAFYAEVSRALNDYLADKLGAPVAGLTRPELGARLAAAGAPPELGARLAVVLDTCDAGRFAPGGTELASMKRVHAEALAVMDAFEATRLVATEEQR